MRADLHTHTVYSDGRYSPLELAKRAKKNGVKLLSVTDHDNMNGDGEKRRACEENGLIYIPGWEISAYEGCKVHILGYNCDTSSPHFKAFMKKRVEGSYIRAEDIIKKLGKSGIFVTLEECEAFHLKKDAPLHTMHIARAIAGKNYASNDGDAYELFLKRGTVGYSDICRPTPYEAVEVIKSSGGFSSLAHPGRLEMSYSEQEELILRLKKYSLDGIEAVYSTHTLKETEYYVSLAERFSLFVTGGSDTHYEDGKRRLGEPFFDADEDLMRALNIPFQRG